MDIFYPIISENSSMQIAPTFLLKVFAHSFFWLTLSIFEQEGILSQRSYCEF